MAPENSYKNYDGSVTTYHSDGTTSRTYKNYDGSTTTYHPDGTRSNTYQNYDGSATTYNSDGSRSNSYRNYDGSTITYHSDGSQSRTYQNYDGSYTTYGSGGYGGSGYTGSSFSSDYPGSYSGSYTYSGGYSYTPPAYKGYAAKKPIPKWYDRVYYLICGLQIAALVAQMAVLFMDKKIGGEAMYRYSHLLLIAGSVLMFFNFMMQVSHSLEMSSFICSWLGVGASLITECTFRYTMMGFSASSAKRTWRFLGLTVLLLCAVSYLGVVFSRLLYYQRGDGVCAAFGMAVTPAAALYAFQSFQFWRYQRYEFTTGGIMYITLAVGIFVLWLVTALLCNKNKRKGAAVCGMLFSLFALVDSALRASKLKDMLPVRFAGAEFALMLVLCMLALSDSSVVRLIAKLLAVVPALVALFCYWQIIVTRFDLLNFDATVDCITASFVVIALNFMAFALARREKIG